jgi:hypothetical protein
MKLVCGNPFLRSPLPKQSIRSAAATAFSGNLAADT